MQRKLYRSASDKRIAGVCGGVGQWLNINGDVVRVLYVLLALLSHVWIGILLYGVLAIFLPYDTEIMNDTASTAPSDKNKIIFYIGAALLAYGAWILIDRLTPFNLNLYTTPALFIVVGIALLVVWSQKRENKQD